MSGLTERVLGLFREGEPMTINDAHAARDLEVSRKQIADVVTRLAGTGHLEKTGLDGREVLYRITEAGRCVLAPDPDIGPGSALWLDRGPVAETRSVGDGAPALERVSERDGGLGPIGIGHVIGHLWEALRHADSGIMARAEALGDRDLVELITIARDLRRLAEDIDQRRADRHA